MAGRNNKYPTHVEPFLDAISAMCRDGLIEEEICKRLDVGVSTFGEYKLEYPALVEALKNGKAIADYNVENSLYSRAMGYEVLETTKEMPELTVLGGEAGIQNIKFPELVITKEVTKELPPDPTSMIFWLKNRRPDKFRDVQHVANTDPLDFTHMTEDEIDKRFDRIKERTAEIRD